MQTRSLSSSAVMPVLSAVLFLAVFSPASSSAESLVLSKKAPYEKSVNIAKAVKDQCRMDSKVIGYIKMFSAKSFDSIVLMDEPTDKTPGTVLSVTITGAVAPKGGATSGIKSLTIAGTLWKDGVVTGTFKARRVTSGGASLVGYKGTCSMLDRSAKRLGKDVSGWLENPTMNAKLGDFK